MNSCRSGASRPTTCPLSPYRRSMAASSASVRNVCLEFGQRSTNRPRCPPARGAQAARGRDHRRSAPAGCAQRPRARPTRMRKFGDAPIAQRGAGRAQWTGIALWPRREGRPSRRGPSAPACRPRYRRPAAALRTNATARVRPRPCPVAGDAEMSRQHPLDVAVQDGSGVAMGKRGDRRRGRATYAGQPGKLSCRARKSFRRIG